MSQVILKIPFDLGNPTGARGAAAAPEAICKLLPKNLRKINVEINPYNFEETQHSITQAALKELKKGKKIIGLGGDHSITYGLIRAASKVYKNLALVYLDAHLDCEDDFLPPSHEDIIKAIVNQEFVKPENILIVGVRKFWPKEKTFINEHNIKVMYRCDLTKAYSKLNNFLINKEAIYVSIDIDVVDPKFAPGTAYPEKEGFSKTEFIKILQFISGFNRNIGIDITEVLPSADYRNKTTRLASTASTVFLTKQG